MEIILGLISRYPMRAYRRWVLAGPGKGGAGSGDDGLVPVEYRYKREGRKNKSKSMSFDWDKRIVRYQVRDKRGKKKLKPETLDKLSYVLALASDLRHGATELSYRVADGGKLKQYRFERREQVSVNTPMGTIQTLLVERMREKSSERHTQLWVAPEYYYLPVKIRHVEKDGEVIEVLITRFSPTSK